NLGTYQSSPGRVITIHPQGAQFLLKPKHDPTVTSRILFGYATDPDTLESATIKAAVLDEAGQRKFKLAAWQAIQRRLALTRGRALITTSLYTSNWLR